MKNKYVYHSRISEAKFRERIVMICESDSPLSGEIEVDESYFGARRIKGKRGRGAYGKTTVFGLLKREGKVYTEIVSDIKAATLQALIRGRVDIGYDKHFRVHHGKNEFVRGRSHINGIESFLSYAKIRLVKFRGIDKKNFNLHLKECEFRFNNRGKDLYKVLLEIFRNNPLKLS